MTFDPGQALRKKAGPIPARLAELSGRDVDAVRAAFAQAHAALVRERGDPTPHRLA